jgi:transcription initiation factor IIF auxiliary subunit
MNKIHLNNISQAIPVHSKQRDYQYFYWKVFVDEDPEILANIDHVTYFLHPTFPNPVQTVSDPETGFALEAKGWGEFELNARVQFKDGSTENTSYRLKLDNSD